MKPSLKSVFLLSCISSSLAFAATPYSNRDTWSGAVVEPRTIDFATNNIGEPITNPASDVAFPSLAIQGVTFLKIRSFWNRTIYVYAEQPLRINLPEGTTSFGADIYPFYQIPGTYSLTLSTGETFQLNAPATRGVVDFLGVVSNSPIQWAEYKLNSTVLFMDNFLFQSNRSVTVTVDLKPDSFPNSVNPRSRGVLPVAILSTSSFNARLVSSTSIRFGVTGAEAAAQSSNFSDMNGDGLTDLLLHFRTQQTGITCATKVLILKGQTSSGLKVQGSDSVVTTGCL